LVFKHLNVQCLFSVCVCVWMCSHRETQIVNSTYDWFVNGIIQLFKCHFPMPKMNMVSMQMRHGISSTILTHPCVCVPVSIYDMFYPQLFFDLHSYTNRKKKSFGSSKRLRTPRSLTRLMQQHRDGERSVWVGKKRNM